MRANTRFSLRKGAVAVVGGVFLVGMMTACNSDDSDGTGPFAGKGQAASDNDKSDGGSGGGGGKGGGRVPAELVGVWTTGSVSGINYQDAITGAYAPPSGTHSELTIKSDGSFAENGLLQSTVYNCTTSLFVMKEGKASVEGDKIAFKPSKVKTTMQNTCAKSGNHTNKDGDKKTTENTFELTEDESGPLLRLTDDQGASSDYRPQK